MGSHQTPLENRRTRGPASWRGGWLSEAKEEDGKMKRKNPHIGSSFEGFLDEEDILEECTNTAIKHVIARQVEQAMIQ